MENSGRSIPMMPERGYIHGEDVNRRRSDETPSSNRSRGPHTGYNMEQIEHGAMFQNRRHSTQQVPNGTSRRMSEHYETRRPSITHPNQVHPTNGTLRVPSDSRRVSEVHRRETEPQRHYSREREFSSRPIRSGDTNRSYDTGYDEPGDDSYVVPALPMPMAIICCCLNFLVPGLGSMVAALCVLCCARTEGMTCREKCGSCCTVFGIGVLQFLLVVCFLIGWIWSCIWGITFIGMSASLYDDDDYDDYNNYPQQSRRRHHPQSGRLPTPEVVVDQPYPGVRYADLESVRSRERRQRSRSRSRRTISRISLTPSNFIYPMRAPSSIHYTSPPPPYRERVTPPPPYWRTGSRDQNQRTETHDPANRANNTDGHSNNARSNTRRQQMTTDVIREERSGR